MALMMAHKSILTADAMGNESVIPETSLAQLRLGVGKNML